MRVDVFGIFKDCTTLHCFFSGVIKIPILGEIKQYKSMAILRDFPYDNALFGLVIWVFPKIGVPKMDGL